LGSILEHIYPGGVGTNLSSEN